MPDAEAEEELNLKGHRLEPYEPLQMGSYRVIAFLANHSPKNGVFLYAIEKEESIFYGTDTA